MYPHMQKGDVYKREEGGRREGGREKARREGTELGRA